MPRYSAILMDHCTSPRNGGPMDAPDAVGKSSLDGRAPYVMIYLRVARRVVTEARFTAYGCGVTIAACSALTELVTEQGIEDCQAITEQRVIDALGGMPPDKEFCVGLAVKALRDALRQLPSEAVEDAQQ